MHNLHRFAVTWASFRKLRDFTYVQPIPRIKVYFGARMAFMLGWLGNYCKMLVPLSVVALLWYAGALILDHGFGVTESQRQILGFTLIVLVWSRIAANYWDREQEYLLKLFNLDHGTVVPTVRPEFKGHLYPSTADSYVEELRSPPIETACKRALSKFLTFSAIAWVAICINLWFNIFEGRFNLLASICLTIQIKIFELIYNKVSLVLNDFENHKYTSDYYDSLLWKRFMFGFVNSYWAFFYIAVKQRFTERGCRAGGCFVDLRNQLRMTLIILTVLSIVMAVVQLLMVQSSLTYNEKTVQEEVKKKKRKRGAADGSTNKEPTLLRSWLEEQFFFSQFETIEQIATMQELVITLGYVILFGGVAPIIIPFCLAAFSVKLQSIAFLLVSSTRQVLPEISHGIGAWRTVVFILMDVAVLFTGFLLAVYSETFAGSELIAKMTGIIVYCIAVTGLWRFMDLVFPPTSATVHTLDTRRHRSKELLMDLSCEYPGELAANKEISAWERRASVQRHGTEQLFKEAIGDDDRMVAEGDWESIPCVRTPEPSVTSLRG
jgi:hypothetical protein